MKTILESIKAWQKGNYEKSYQLYLQDEGSYGIINFENFCKAFPNIVKRHKENEETVIAHSKLVTD